MSISIQQAAAEQSIHDLLEADDPDTLADFADFAAGEIDDKHVAALLLAILQSGNHTRWSFLLATVRQYAPDLADAIDTLENALERQRAKFIESEARELLAQADLSNEVAAEKARGDHA